MLANIAIGSNIGDPAANVKEAIERLSRVCTLVVSSSLYATPPWGVVDQADFCNAAVQVETKLTPHQLLVAIKQIEHDMGRTATYRWGPRLIDLDLLTYGDVQLSDDILTVPHPHMNERAFVLVPLAEIDSRFIANKNALPQSELDAVRLMTND